ncbi:MAG: hypothetical protein ACRYGF_13925 [Janthinobacterium lividum]
MSLSTLRPSRRDLLRQAGLISAAVAIGPIAAEAASIVEPQAAVKHLVAKGTPNANLFTEIGVRPILNARGTYTIISGSQSLPEVKQAMFEASQYYVQLDELMAAVGKQIAQLMGAPGAIVTCGCEAAIALATVACMCGTDPEKSQAFPYKKAKSQVLIPGYARNQYDFATRMAGAEIVTADTDDDLRSKLGDQVAMIYIISGPRAFQEPLSIKTICAIAKEKGVPVFVDAAAEEPLVPNIHLQAGATFVGYSGGKCMRGPQTAGVLLGPPDLVKAAFWNAAPHHNWGRALKVGKEEAMGMLAAVRMWYQRDHGAEQKQWLAWDQHIADALKGIPSLTAKIEMPTDDLSNRAPTVSIEWDAAQVGITGTELVKQLNDGTPRILVAGGEGKRPDSMKSSISVMPYMMQPGDYKVVADALSKHLRKPGTFTNPATSSAPDANIAGTWNVTIDYSVGTGKQQLILTQTGTTVAGNQAGEIFQADMRGKVQGDHVELHSSMPANGSTINFAFTGTVSGGNYSGDVSLGEYGTAKFTAVRA